MTDKKYSLEETLEDLLNLVREGKLTVVNIIGLLDENGENCGCFEFLGTSLKDLDLRRIVSLYLVLLNQIDSLRKSIKEIAGKDIKELLTECKRNFVDGGKALH
jgi:hypothetical protein